MKARSAALGVRDTTVGGAEVVGAEVVPPVVELPRVGAEPSPPLVYVPVVGVEPVPPLVYVPLDEPLDEPLDVPLLVEPAVPPASQGFQMKTTRAMTAITPQKQPAEESADCAAGRAADDGRDAAAFPVCGADAVREEDEEVRDEEAAPVCPEARTRCSCRACSARFFRSRSSRARRCFFSLSAVARALAAARLRFSSSSLRSRASRALRSRASRASRSHSARARSSCFRRAASSSCARRAARSSSSFRRAARASSFRRAASSCAARSAV